MTWRLGSLIHHALRTVRVDLGRSITLALFTAVLCGLVAQSDLRVARDLRMERESRVESGLYVLQATSDSGLNSSICEMLGGRGGFVGSGGLRSGPLVRLETDGLTQIPTGDISTGLLNLSSRDLSQLTDGTDGGFFVGQALADQLAVVPGSTISLANGSRAAVNGIVPETHRTRFVAGWLLAVAPPTGDVDECWIETVQGGLTTGERVVRSVFADSAGLTVTPMIQLDERSRDLSTEWRSRPARDLIRVGLAGALVLGLLLSLVRRSEFGLYRALGMRRRQLLLVTLVETIAVVSIGGAIGTTWSIAYFVSGSSSNTVVPTADLLVAFRDAAAVAAWLIAIVPATSLLSRGSIMDALKDR